MLKLLLLLVLLLFLCCVYCVLFVFCVCVCNRPPSISVPPHWPTLPTDVRDGEALAAAGAAVVPVMCVVFALRVLSFVSASLQMPSVRLLRASQLSGSLGSLQQPA